MLPVEIEAHPSETEIWTPHANCYWLPASAAHTSEQTESRPSCMSGSPLSHAWCCTLICSSHFCSALGKSQYPQTRFASRLPNAKLPYCRREETINPPGRHRPKQPCHRGKKGHCVVAHEDGCERLAPHGVVQQAQANIAAIVFPIHCSRLPAESTNVHGTAIVSIHT